MLSPNVLSRGAMKGAAMSQLSPQEQGMYKQYIAPEIDALPKQQPGPMQAPQPQPAPQPVRSPYNSPMPAPKPNALGGAFKSFAQGFLGPEKINALDKMQSDKQAEVGKRALAWIQQTAQLPPQARAQFTLQNAQRIAADTGQPVEAVMQSAQDPNAFSDEAMQQAIAQFSAQMGQGPAQTEAYTLAPGARRYGPDGKIISENPAAENTRPVLASPGQRGYQDINGDGILDEIFSVPDKPGAEKAPILKEGGNGNWWTFDPETRKMEDTGIPAPKPSGGVTINMPGNVREGVGPDGRPVFVGIDPKNPEGGFQTIPGATPPSNMMSAETRSKFAALAPGAFAGIAKLKEMFGANQKEDPLEGVGGTAAAVASNVPFVGDAASRVIGGQKWQDFQQAWSAIELGVHIPAGAAVSPSEAMRFLRANQPGLYESRETKMRKIANVESFYQGLEAGYRGDWSMMERLIKSSTAAATPESGSKAPALDAEEQAMVNQLRAAGYTQAQIDKIISGQ